jgi:hypothetical protein
MLYHGGDEPGRRGPGTGGPGLGGRREPPPGGETVQTSIRTRPTDSIRVIISNG